MQTSSIKRLLLGALAAIQYPINAASICQVITDPGEYDFGIDQIGSPTDPNDALICIQSDDVVINLDGHVLGQDPSNTVSGFDIIRINPNFKNITIKNGFIKHATGSGIVAGEGCLNITVQDLTISNCNATGILFAGSLSNIIENGLIANCFVLSCTGSDGAPAYGIRLIRSDDVLIDNCIVEANDAGVAQSGFGISIEFGSACKVSNCHINDNGGNDLGVGVSISQSQWTFLDEVQVFNSIARTASGKAVGFLLDTCNYSTIRNCISQHNFNLLGSAYGFEAFNGIDNTLRFCISNNNSAGNVSAGFVFNGTENRSTLFKSSARLNDAGVAGTGYGLLLNGANNCDIWYNQFIGNRGAAAYGLNDTTVDTTNLIVGNVAFNNSSTNFQVTRTVGQFPVVTAPVGDFTATWTVGKYYNIDFVLPA